MNLTERYYRMSAVYNSMLERRDLLKGTLVKAQENMEKCLAEMTVIEASLQALKDVKPILAANSIEQCEKLANAALQAIFDTDAKVEFDAEEGRFMINEGEYKTDLAEDNGGGYVAVIS